MQLANYLGALLKSEAIIEVLEHFEMPVIYDFDRLQENTADSYSASAKQAGFEFCFDERQVLEVIWCYVLPRSGFSAISLDIVGATSFDTFAAAKAYAAERDVKISQSKTGESWIRFEYDGLWVHYEFQNTQPTLITLTKLRNQGQRVPPLNSA
jgi:hypothetical protein